MADQQTLLSWADSIRKQKQQGGFVLNGMKIDTDTESLVFLMMAYGRAKDDSSFTIQDWKIGDGVYVALDNAAILAATLAALDFIERCYSKNREVDADIASGAITTRDQIISAFEAI